MAARRQWRTSAETLETCSADPLRDDGWIRTHESGHNEGVPLSTTMAAADAQMLWLSPKIPNDQFLLYAFDGAPNVDAGVTQLRRNVEWCAELRLRVVDEGGWRYPRWEPAGIRPEQFVVHQAAPRQECLAALAGLEPLDATRMAWRAHVFPPGIVVVQISHALGDGPRSAALAAALLGRRTSVPPVAPADRGFLPWRAIAAARAHRRLVRDTESGLVATPCSPRPPLSVNARPSGSPVLHTALVHRDTLRKPTVTVGALSAIAEALGSYLADRGEDTDRLGAEVPMAHGVGINKARNNFRNVGIDLHPHLGRVARTERIAEQLVAHRRRGEHAATRTSTAAFATMPAVVLRWGVGQFDPTVRSATVSGHTVVSSVNRGPADLCFGGCPVTFTAGYPALSPMMSLTHGVHGIGDTVAVSVHADPTTVDVEDYLQRLSRALGCQQ